MKDTIITLLEEPSKLKKILFNLLEIILFSIITSVAYTNFFGPYELILPTDEGFLSKVYEFIISGRVLLVVFLYLFSKYSTIIILIILPLGILKYISKKFKRKLGKNRVIYITAIVSSAMEITSLNLKTGEVRLGPKFKEFNKRLQSYTKHKIETELADWKDSFISEVFLLYSLFVYVYFFVLQIETHWVLDVTIVVVLLFIISIFYFVHICVSFVGIHREEILEFFTLIKQVHYTEAFMIANKVKIIHKKQQVFQQNMNIDIDTNKYYIYNLNASHRITTSVIENIVKAHQEGNIIIISPQTISKEVEKFIDSTTQVSYISFITKKKLFKKLDKVFRNTIQRIENTQKPSK